MTYRRFTQPLRQGRVTVSFTLFGRALECSNIMDTMQRCIPKGMLRAASWEGFEEMRKGKPKR